MTPVPVARHTTSLPQHISNNKYAESTCLLVSNAFLHRYQWCRASVKIDGIILHYFREKSKRVLDKSFKKRLHSSHPSPTHYWRCHNKRGHDKSFKKRFNSGHPPHVHYWRCHQSSKMLQVKSESLPNPSFKSI